MDQFHGSQLAAVITNGMGNLFNGWNTFADFKTVPYFGEFMMQLGNDTNIPASMLLPRMCYIYIFYMFHVSVYCQ